MNSVIEKVNLAQWILGLTDDFVIKKVSKSIEKLKKEIEGEKALSGYTSYQEIKNKKFSFDEVKLNQNIQPFEDGELAALIKEADIQEPIEVLLESID